MALPGAVRWLCSAVAFFLLLAPDAGAAPAAREMPVTTRSREALALFQQGRDHFANVEVALAAPLFDQAIQKDERFALAHAYRALSGGGMELARARVDRAVALAGGASPGERLWIESARAQVYGDTAALASSLEALLAMHPDDKAIQLRAGDIRQNVGDTTGATRHFERAVALDAGYAAAHNALGYARMAAGDLAGAEGSLRRYVELRPRSPNAHDSLGELLLKMGRFDDSVSAYRQALALDPTFSSSWDGIGHCQVLRGRYTEAREAYARSASVAGGLNGKLTARHWRTVSYVHEGRTGEALASFEELRAFADEHGAPAWAVWSHLNAAWVLLEADAVGAAARELDAAAARAANPALPAPLRGGLEVAAQRLRVLALARIHEFEAARALAQRNRAAAEARKDEAAQRWLSGVQAWAELEAGNVDAALDHAARAVRDNAWTVFVEGLARERKGEAAEARRAFAQVARWNQNDLGFALVRARALARAGGAM